MGNSNSTSSFHSLCNIISDPPDLRDRCVDLLDFEEMISNFKNKQSDENKKNDTTNIKNKEKENEPDDDNQVKKIDNLKSSEGDKDKTISSKNNMIQDENFDTQMFRTLIDLRANTDVLPIYDMSIEQVGMTAVNSICAIIYSKLLSKGGSLFCPSRCFIYYNTLFKDNKFKDLDENAISSSKLCLRDHLKALKRFGVCNEKNYSYSFDTLLRKPSDLCYNEGKYLNFDYHRVPISIELIKYFLSKNEIVLCNMSIYNSFLDNETRSSGRIRLPQEIDSYLGMLACSIVGYLESNQTFILRFSFGTFWGDKGYGFINYEYAEKLINDMWIINIDVPFIGNFSDILTNRNSHQTNDYMTFQNMSNSSFMSNNHSLNVHSGSNINASRRKYKVGGFSAI